MNSKSLIVLILSLVVVITASQKFKNKYRERNLQLRCSVGQYLSYAGDACLSNCPMTEYISFSGTNCLRQCNQGQYISSTGNQCTTSCAQQEVYFDNYKKCRDNCGQGFFKSSSGQVCVGTCSQGQYISVDQSQCLADCEQGQFKKASPDKCLTQCPANESVAADRETCVTSCNSIGQLISAASQSRCVTACTSPPEFLSSDSLSCTDECVYTEFSSGNQCYTTCPGALFGDSTTRSCVSTCPVGFFQQVSGRVCSKCHSNCLTCNGTGANQCLTCHPGANFDPATNRCLSITCQPGSFLQGTQCQACNESCLTCSSLNVCTSCYDNFLPQSDGTCITCRPNQYFTAAGCQDCPVSYDAANLLTGQARSQAFAVCEIKMNKAQVQGQIDTTLKTTLGTVASLSQESSSKDVAKSSRSFIQLSLSLVSKLQDNVVFQFSNDDLSMKAQPIVSGQDFALQVAKPTASNPNPSKVEMPSAIAALFTDAKVVAMQCNLPLFNNPKIGNFQPPVLSIQIKKKSKSQTVQALPQPIKLTLFVESSQLLAGRFYDPSTSSWSNQGIQTSQRVLPNGKVEVQITTRHLTSFSVGIAPTVSSDGDMQGVYIALGLTLGLLFILLIISKILDSVKKNRSYPHEKLTSSNYSFKTVFGYSLLYNLPLISIFGYRDKVIPNFGKALWLLIIYIVVIIVSFVVFAFSLLNGSVLITAIILSLTLSLLLLPNSVFVKILRVKDQNEVSPVDQFDGGQGAKSSDVDSRRPVSEKPAKRRQMYKLRKTGAVLLFLISILFLIGGAVGIYFLGKKIVDDNNENRLLGVLGAFCGSVVVGYVYGLLKLLIGAHVAMNFENASGFTKLLFLDDLTYEVVKHFKGASSPSHQRKTSRDSEESDDRMRSQQEISSSDKSSKKKKGSKKKSKNKKKEN